MKDKSSISSRINSWDITNKIPSRDDSKHSKSEWNDKKHWVTFDSGYENASRVHLGDKIVYFPFTYGGIYLSKPDDKFLGNCPNITKGRLLKY